MKLKLKGMGVDQITITLAIDQVANILERTLQEEEENDQS